MSDGEKGNGQRQAGMAGIREFMIKQALEAEMRGWRLTAKAPRGFKIIADEYGIKAKRGPAGKRAAYEAFCKATGQEPKPAPGAPVPPPAPSAPITMNAPGGEA